MGLFDSKSSNPMFKDDILDSFSGTVSEKMTINGTINKTLILLGITVITAFFSWKQMLVLAGTSLMPVLFGTAIVGFILVMVGMRKPQYAHIVAPFYAFVEGLFIGVVSALYAYQFEGIVINAVLLTFGTLFTMLLLYRSGAIKVTDRFRKVMYVAIGAVGILYLATWILGFMGISIPFMHDSSPLAIGVSIAILVIAALTLLLDFDMIENNVKKGAPKSMEWVGSMALLVTIVWLYLEFLRLLSKLQD